MVVLYCTLGNGVTGWSLAVSVRNGLVSGCILEDWEWDS